MQAFYLDDPNCLCTSQIVKDLGMQFFSIVSDVEKPGQLDFGNEQVMCVPICFESSNQPRQIRLDLQREHTLAENECLVATSGIALVDVRDTAELWIRIELRKGNALVLPAYLMRRIFVHKEHYFEARCLFRSTKVHIINHSSYRIINLVSSFRTIK